jgi:hypothetical protein
VNYAKDLKTKILFIALIIHTTCLFSQNQMLILTREQNDKWYEDLKSSNLVNQLDLIKSRMLSDTSIFITKLYPDRLTIDRFPQLDSLRKIRTIGFCKPLYVISFKQKEIEYLHFDNPIQTYPIKRIAELINSNNIYEVEILKDDNATAIYGTNGNCGVLLLKTNNRKFWKELKRLNILRD